MEKFNVADRSAKLIYKDLIKMVKKTLPEYKHKAVLKLLRKEFEKNKNVNNPKEIEILKLNAGKAIADTLIYKVKEEHKKNKENFDRIDDSKNIIV